MKKLFFLFAVISSTIYSQDLIGNYSFNSSLRNEASVFSDLIGNAITFTRDRFDNERRAVHFNGRSSYLYTENPNFIFSGNNEFSISVWVKFSRITPNNTCIVSSGNKDAGNFVVTIGLTKNIIRFGVGKQMVKWCNADYYHDNLEPDVWYHIVGIYKNKTAYLYLNGLKVSTTDFNLSTKSASLPFSVGADYNSSNDIWDYLNGDVDDLQIYDYALSQKQVVELYKEK